MAEAEAFGEALEGFAAFDGVQVLALEVLDQGPLGEGLVVQLAEDGGDVLKVCESGGAPSAFAGDDFVGAFAALLWLVDGCGGADDDRLHEAIGLDGVGQSFEGGLIKDFAGLMRVGLELGDRDVVQIGGFGACLGYGLGRWGVALRVAWGPRGGIGWFSVRDGDGCVGGRCGALGGFGRRRIGGFARLIAGWRGGRDGLGHE